MPPVMVEAPLEADEISETLPTLQTLAEQRRAQARSQVQVAPVAPVESAASSTTANITDIAPDVEGAAPGSPEDLQEEAGQQGAFNEETGEINWECPCLGGMAHGPCGEQFRTAFSCFVYSKEEPKGVDCIEHFKTMQNCFREHPDIYGAELDDEETEAQLVADSQAGSADAQPSSSTPSPALAPESGAGESPATGSSDMPSLANVSSPHGHGEKVAETKPHFQPDSDAAVAGKRERAQAATAQVARDHGPVSESEKAVPKSWHDGR